MAEAKKNLDIVQIVCVGIGIFVGMILVRVVFGLGGILGGALGGGLGAAIGIGIYTLINSRKK